MSEWPEPHESMAKGQVRLNKMAPWGGASLSFMVGIGRLLQGALSAGPITKDATEVGQLGDAFASGQEKVVAWKL